MRLAQAGPALPVRFLPVKRGSVVSDSIERIDFPEHENPVTVFSGPGAIGQAAGLLADLGAQRVMIVCGQTVAGLPAAKALADSAKANGAVRVFDQVEPDPSDVTCAAGGTAARDFGAEAIVGIGGGSSMDAAKAIAAEAIQAGWTQSQDNPGQPTEVDFEPLPTILIPTTAGTASEVTPFSVIIYTETKRKLVLSHPKLYAKYALLDPELLSTCSPQVRMAAGMDALTHAIESYVSKQATEQTRRRALEAIRMLAPHLVRAVEAPGDMAAQQQVQEGAMIAALAFSKSRLGIVHAMALPLSALFQVPHGVANALLLPYGMRFNAEAAAPLYADIAEACGIEISGLTASQAAITLIEHVEQLGRAIGAPTRMAEVGVEEAAIPQMAQDAMPSAHIACNPRTPGMDDLIELYTEAY